MINKDQQNLFTKENWEKAKNKLTELGNLVNPYTIPIAFDDSGSIGISVFIKYKNKKVLLTPTHVARQLKKSKKVYLILRFDNLRREYPPRNPQDFVISEWDSTFNENQLKNVLKSIPKDLAIIEPSPDLTNMLETYKQPYLIAETNITCQDSLFTYGITNNEKSDENTFNSEVSSLSITMSNYEKKSDDIDYIVSNVSSETFGIKNLNEKVIANFQGLSGGGLWKLIDQKPHLVGIAIAQDLTGYESENKNGQLYFHGPQSIMAMMKFWYDSLKI